MGVCKPVKSVCHFQGESNSLIKEFLDNNAWRSWKCISFCTTWELQWRCVEQNLEVLRRSHTAGGNWSPAKVPLPPLSMRLTFGVPHVGIILASGGVMVQAVRGRWSRSSSAASYSFAQAPRYILEYAILRLFLMTGDWKLNMSMCGWLESSYEISIAFFPGTYSVLILGFTMKRKQSLQRDWIQRTTSELILWFTHFATTGGLKLTYVPEYSTHCSWSQYFSL